MFEATDEEGRQGPYSQLSDFWANIDDLERCNSVIILRAFRGTRQFSEGFTLMEILVALFIFSVVGMISAQLLGRTLDAYEVLEDRESRLAQIHRAMFVVQRDMLQYQKRAIRTASGESFPPLMIGDEVPSEMTRGRLA